MHHDSSLQKKIHRLKDDRLFSALTLAICTLITTKVEKLHLLDLIYFRLLHPLMDSLQGGSDLNTVSVSDSIFKADAISLALND